MIKRAVAVQVKADPTHPKPGDQVTFTLTLINAGAGHKIPTGDPDRHFTIEFLVEDRAKRVIQQDSSTMGRWILWQPAIVELYDNRLLPLASREYRFSYRMPAESEGLALKARVQYHIVTDGQHETLRTKYGLTATDPYRFEIYAREFPLTAEFSSALSRGSNQQTALRVQPESPSCRVKADS
jgi:hypothetical protein